MAASICLKNKYGFCKFRNTCRNHHVNEKCENVNCDIKLCEKRHPVECKFFRSYQRCKFLEFCHYEHKIVKTSNNIENDMNNLKEKMDMLESNLSEKKNSN